MKHGEYTKRLGEQLIKLLHESGLLDIAVYYDHGHRSDPNVCKPTPYFGEYSTGTTLSNVDLAVVKNNEVKVLCEIEEEGGSPKKIIGDVCNLLLAEKIRIKGSDYPLDEFFFLLGIKLAEKGKGIAKLKALEIGIPEMVRPDLREKRKIRFIYANEYDKLIDIVKKEIYDTALSYRSPSP